MQSTRAATGPGEPASHAFVVRVWREDGQRPVWRGQIIHVGSGARRSVTRLEQLSLFICEYLAALQVALPPLWRLRRWLDQREGTGRRA